MSKTSAAKTYFYSLPASTRGALQKAVRLAIDEGIIDENGDPVGEKKSRIEELCSEYVQTGSPETLESICNLIGVEPDGVLARMPAPGAGGDREERIALLRKLSAELPEEGNNGSALDRAKHAMDAAQRKYRRLAGRGMTMDELLDWKQRHLTHHQRHLLAMDSMKSSGPIPSFDDVFLAASRFSPRPFDVEAELSATLKRIGAA